jgi:hypothetical protein
LFNLSGDSSTSEVLRAPSTDFNPDAGRERLDDAIVTHQSGLIPLILHAYANIAGSSEREDMKTKSVPVVIV